MARSSQTRSSRMPAFLRRGITAAAVGSLALTGVAAGMPAATAAEHGSTPTQQSITQNGTYSVTTRQLRPLEFSGFGGGTLYYPSNAKPGEKFALIVTMPGYMEPGVVNSLVAKRWASHGFIVLQANTYTGFEQPEQRGQMALRAVEAGKRNPAVQSIIDPSRTALMGHSMGGGGVLYAAERGDFKAVITAHPWAQKGFPGVREPVLTVGGLIDTTAPYYQYTVPIHTSLTNSQDKYLINDLAGTHWAALADQPALQGRMLSFLKVHVDGDQRYAPLLCQSALKGTTFRSASC